MQDTLILGNSPVDQIGAPPRSSLREGGRWAVIDLDDTLLGPDKRISSANQHALHLLRTAGFETIIASGRHHQNILRFEENTGVLTWIVSSAGAAVRHAQTQELLHEFTLPEVEALNIYAAARSAGLSVIVYHRDGVFIEEESEWTRLYAQGAGWTPEIRNLSRLAASGVQKVLLVHSGERMASIRSSFDRDFGGRLYVVETQEEMLEFLSPRANKARGIEALASKLGVDRAGIIAFGDGNNDIELLLWAGFSVAMSHGRPGARKAACRISPNGPPETAFARAVDLALADQGYPNERYVTGTA